MHSFYKKSYLLALALMLTAPPVAYGAEDGERKGGIIKRMIAQKRESANNPEGSKKGFYVKGKGQR